MKKAFFIMAITLAACVSCNSNQSQQTDALQDNMLDSLVIHDGLGDVLERRYAGTIPAADGPGIYYDITLYNQQHSGDGVYSLTQTYLDADNGKDVTFASSGKWNTLRGSAADPDDTVYQLHPYNGDNGITNFLFQHDSITMLNSSFELAPSGLNYTLKKL